MSKSSTARVFKVENALAAVVRLPGGKKVKQAVHDAGERIESARESCLAALVEKADSLPALAAAARAGDLESLTLLYGVTNAIYGVAATYGETALAKAAFSLCDVAHGFLNGEPANWGAVDVHVDGIRLLAAMGREVGEAGEAAILGGLERVRNRVLRADA